MYIHVHVNSFLENSNSCKDNVQRHVQTCTYIYIHIRTCTGVAHNGLQLVTVIHTPYMYVASVAQLVERSV